MKKTKLIKYVKNINDSISIEKLFFVSLIKDNTVDKERIELVYNKEKINNRSKIKNNLKKMEISDLFCFHTTYKKFPLKITFNHDGFDVKDEPLRSITISVRSFSFSFSFYNYIVQDLKFIEEHIVNPFLEEFYNEKNHLIEKEQNLINNKKQEIDKIKKQILNSKKHISKLNKLKNKKTN